MFLSIKRYRDLLIVLVLGSSQLALYCALYLIGNLSKAIMSFVGNYAALFLFYVSSIVLFKMGIINIERRSVRFFLFIFPILFRIPMVASQVSLSTDILRYLWDGTLLSNGIDPYKYVPSSNELQRFQNVSYYVTYDHKDEFTIYPPFAQVFFALNYALFGGNPIGMKSLLSIFDIVNGLLVFMIIMRLRQDSFGAHLGALIYLWNPLAIIEFSNSGHVDALAIMFLLSSIYFLVGSSIDCSSILVSMSCLIKWFPLVTIPLFAKHVDRHNGRFVWRAVLLTCLVFAVATLPFYLSSGFGFASSMADYVSNWRFESALSRLLTLLVYSSNLGESSYVKILSYAIFMAMYSIIVKKADLSGKTSVIDHSILVLSLLYFVFPAVYPWYAVWPLALVSLLEPSAKTWLCVAFTGVVIVNYVQQFYSLSEFQFWFAYALWYLPIFCIMLSYILASRNGKPI